MSFYGNLGSTKDIHFQFDKIFSNRKEMDTACATNKDGVYQGRFVLVKYDSAQPFFNGDILYGFLDLNENSNEPFVIYADPLYQQPYVYTDYDEIIITSENIEELKAHFSSYYEKISINNFNYYSILSNENQIIEGNTIYEKQNENPLAVSENTIIYKKNVTTKLFDGKFYVCIGKQENTDYALWSLISDYSNYGDYLSNFQIDATAYQEFFDYRGYDATVWEKTYTDGVGKYIQIARLNGSIPAIELLEDKPTILPSAAYIDAKSSPDLYSIHVPAHWGFRFKEAIDNPSEQVVIQPYYNTLDNTVVQRAINADVYYNLHPKDENGNELSFKSYKTRDNTTDNEILIEPTGITGKKYNGAEETDTYELSIHLPVVGNFISDGYDMIYGENEPDAETGLISRPTDIEWYDGASSDELKENGNEFLGGKTYDLTTFAGTLNTMHKRLGQIVCHLEEMPSQSQIDNLSFNYLYEIRGSLYRRGIKYRKITLDDYIYKIDKQAENHYNNGGITLYTYNGVDNLGNPIYQEAEGSYDSTKTYYTKEPWCKYDQDLNAATEFSPNKYYEKDGNNYIPSTDTIYNSNKEYYLKNVNPSRYTEVLLTRYEAGAFYYQNGESFICDYNYPNPMDLNRSYYTIVQPDKKETFAAGYEPGTYYKLDEETQVFIRDDSEVPDILDERPYYDLKNVTKTPTSSPCIFYQPGQFYYEKKDGTEPIKRCDEPMLTQELLRDYDFYIYTFSDVPKYGRDNDGNIIEYYEQLDAVNISSYLQNPNSNTTYYYINNDGKEYIPYDILYKFIPNAYTIPRTYYTIAQPNQYSASSLYIPGRYYEYYPETKHYIKAYGPFDKNSTYYTLPPDNISLVRYPFYAAHKYYFQPDAINLPNRYDLAIDDLMDENKAPFYTKTSFYVDKDETNNCPHGYEWSPLAAYIPPTITLYAREEIPALIALDAAYSGDQGLASINGQLLQLHQSYDPFNDEVRDNTTFRGALNSARDVLYQIKTLEPGRICYVNNFGQIETFDLGSNKLLMTNASGWITPISLQELKTKLNEIE